MTRGPSLVREAARALCARLGYRVTRMRPANRFQALDEALLILRRRGYAPRVLIDVGANRGEWAQMAMSIFPSAACHLIEPQVACHQNLQELAARHSLLVVHPLAVSEPGRHHVALTGNVEDGGTGVGVIEPWDDVTTGVECPATTLDDLLVTHVSVSDRALLKLDLEGHELSALKGSSALLPHVEVIVTEVRFYAINGNPRPTFLELASYLHDRGFDVHDFASLGPRKRDQRLCMADVIFVRRDSPLSLDQAWL